ncbi:TlpA family protein disulfide reductase [Aquabacterium fontiphilum]|uniref:TlpA family protein disulfide reductase n=1 Tax=Aquabacterium fontiphilum TaxID=450365 RepID=UPI002ED0653F
MNEDTPVPVHRGRRVALMAAAGAAAAVAGWWWRSRSPLSQGAQEGPGDPLPDGFWDLAFDTPDGAPLDWQALAGQPFVLNFWATWCPPCVREMPELDRFQREHAAQGWQVVGLAVDGPTPVREFLAKVGVGFRVGLAGFGGTELARELGNTAGGLPFTVIVDAQGRIRHRKMGETHFDELAKWARDVAGDTPGRT